MTITEIKRKNKESGRYFFSPHALRFFNSTVYPRTFSAPQGTLFVTSERMDNTRPLRYTVRRARPDGDIVDVGEFQAYGSLQEAYAAAKLVAKDEKP